jgi:hypothetical protein
LKDIVCFDAGQLFMNSNARSFTQNVKSVAAEFAMGLEWNACRAQIGGFMTIEMVRLKPIKAGYLLAHCTKTEFLVVFNRLMTRLISQLSHE